MPNECLQHHQPAIGFTCGESYCSECTTEYLAYIDSLPYNKPKEPNMMVWYWGKDTYGNVIKTYRMEVWDHQKYLDGYYNQTLQESELR